MSAQARRSFSVTVPTMEQILNFAWKAVLIYLPVLGSVVLTILVVDAFWPLNRRFYITLHVAVWMTYAAVCFMIWFAVSQIQFKSQKARVGFLASTCLFHFAVAHVILNVLR